MFSTVSASSWEYLVAEYYNPFRYRGYYWDFETGNYYLQTRYYNPEWGRFISPDSYTYLGSNGDLMSFNLYVYCSNNPITYSDPYGRGIILTSIIVGTIFGFAFGVGVEYMNYIRRKFMKCEVKPLRTVHTYFLVWVLTLASVFLALGVLGYVLHSDEFFAIMIWTCSAIMGVFLLIYIAVRLFYPVKYIIDDAYITKYHGKTVLFRIKKCDIERVYIKKAPIFDYILFCTEILGISISKPYGTNLSFAFEKCDVLTPQDTCVLERLPLKQPWDLSKEYIELFTYSQCKKICRLLDPATEVCKSAYWR